MAAKRSSLKTQTRLDPYEEYLRKHDPATRRERGVYFTPPQIVRYVVRSVDHALRAHLGLRDGLSAGSATVIDPACGTGAFLSGVIEHVRAGFIARRQPGAWREFARDKFLPRLIGTELLAEPVELARKNLSWLLAGGDLPAGKRRAWGVRVESAAALNLRSGNPLGGNGAPEGLRSKQNGPVTVVLGNPPYRGISENRYAWIDDLLRNAAPGDSSSPGYYEIDGAPLREKKVWLQDDYVKFIRYGQWMIEQAGAGILAFVTNHAYLDNPTFRGMRRSLMHTFEHLYVIDLHGNSKKKERGSSGSRDGNVFDIQQGVSIGLFIRTTERKPGSAIHHAERWGPRDAKLDWLNRHDVAGTRFRTISSRKPFYFFVPRDHARLAEYERGWSITDIFPLHSTGIVTARDRFVVDFDEAALLRRIADLRNRNLSDEEIRRRYFSGRGAKQYAPGDSRGWKLPVARRVLREDRHWQRRIVPCLYRPFDVRPMYYVPWMVDWPRGNVMKHMPAGDNPALITVRQVAEGIFNHAFVSRTIVDGRVTLSNRGIAYVFPLHVYPEAAEPWNEPPQNLLPSQESSLSAGAYDRCPNLNSDFVATLSNAVRLRFLPEGAGDLTGTFGPEDILHYAYATLHSPDYRKRYAEFLKSDFPRIPVHADRAEFRAAARLGRKLCGLHFLQPAQDGRSQVGFPVEGSNEVSPGFPKYVAPGEPDPFDAKHRPHKTGRVYINRGGGEDSNAQYFEGVPPDAWHHQLCGYQPACKYLADRRRRNLCRAERKQYCWLMEALHRALGLLMVGTKNKADV